MTNYGATSQEWFQFDLMLGLTADLLPVVSKPDAPISPGSKMKEKGKTPSRYNKLGNVSGIIDWPLKISTPREVSQWSQNSDYGICVQTRYVRALDIDVANQELSNKIVEFINGYLNWLGLPARSRSNSGKILLAFKVKGEMVKRVMKVNGGIIEFLANGQQFVSCGTHPSGVRYEWTWNNHDDFPELTLEEFEKLWKALTDEFATEDPTAGSIRKREADIEMEDSIIDHLDVLGWGKDGQAFIDCPWKHEHTSDTGEAQTVYFPAGTKGYEQGHFKCLHAHCAKRSDAEFVEALRILEKQFDNITDIPPAEDSSTNSLPEETKSSLVLPSFKRDKHGSMLATLDNLCLALEASEVCKMLIRFDEFRDEILISPKDKPDQWRPFTDNDSTALRRYMEQQGFAPIGREIMRDAINLVAGKNTFDSAIYWLENIPKWDGKSRVEGFLKNYFGCEDTLYNTAISKYIWTTLAGRILSPGCKADMVPILEGDEGVQKSSAIAAMVPAMQFFVEVSFHESDDNIARKIRGKIIGEIAELRGLHTKEAEGILAFVTRTHENWTPKYKEFNSTFARRLLFMGTTNTKDILDSGRKNRRWLPTHVTRADIDKIIKDRLQLWAEARTLFTIEGVYWQAEQFTAEAHEEFARYDSWKESVIQWLDQEDVDGIRNGDTQMKMSDVLRYAIGLETHKQDERHANRVGSCLRSLGYIRKSLRVDGKPVRVWVKQ